MPGTKEVIPLGQVEVRFLLESMDTGGVQSMFEFAVIPGARVPSPHYHNDFDELIYGLEGLLTFVVDDVPHQIGPGDHVFIPRGKVHHFVNEGEFTTRTLVVITPALLGPEYFREMAHLLTSDDAPDPVKIGEVMGKHGLTAVR